ncbi:MAG: YigZ family protein [Tenericutes bacterium]|nr:YigZ family protein [Mycoplasmatota bacterium]
MFVIDKENIYEMIIKNSKFISYIYKVNSLNDIEIIINDIKNKYKDATHICYAYKIDNLIKTNDDNEPTGTAGLPILEVINKNNLNYTIIIVVRYFGGIKLGAGGLLRAYSKGASNVVKLCNLKKLIKGFDITITFGYDNLKNIDYLLKEENIYDKKYHDKIKYSFKTSDNNIIDKIKNNKDITINNINEIYIEKN